MVARIGSLPASIELDYDSIDEAFPEVDVGLRPFGSWVLIQKRSPMTRTRGGIEIPIDTQETEFWNTQVAKVVALGPVAFKNRDTLEPWVECRGEDGEFVPWCKGGDYVRVPKYGGDLWPVPLPKAWGSRYRTQTAFFQNFRDLDLIGSITCNPLDVVAYI